MTRKAKISVAACRARRWRRRLALEVLELGDCRCPSTVTDLHQVDVHDDQRLDRQLLGGNLSLAVDRIPRGGIDLGEGDVGIAGSR